MVIPIPYNLSLTNNASSYVGLFQLVNDNLMQGLFGTLILVAIWVITFMAFVQSTGHAIKSIATSSFICFSLALLLRIIGVINNNVLMIFLALAAFSIPLLLLRD